MIFQITIGKKGRIVISLNSLFVLGMGRILASFYSSGKVDLVSSVLKWVQYGKSLGVKTFKNKGSKSSEPITVNFTTEIHSKISS